MAYHPENMRRLGFPLAKADGKQISGSGFMLEYAEREHCRDLYGVRRVGGNGEKSAQFLRNNLDFLRL
jgi:hypothetical protein